MRWFRAPALALFAAVLAVAATACDGGEAADGGSDTLPSWVVSVDPAPGAAVAVPDLVRVTFEPTGADQIVRMLVDGIDVTGSAALEGGVLVYDPDRGPVALGPGEHSVTVRLMERPTPDATDFAVVDEFTWTFRAG